MAESFGGGVASARAAFAAGLESDRAEILAAEMTATYTEYLLGKVPEANVTEGHRIGRELHDRIGHGLGIAHHQLQLRRSLREAAAGGLGADRNGAAIHSGVAQRVVGPGRRRRLRVRSRAGLTGRRSGSTVDAGTSGLDEGERHCVRRAGPWDVGRAPCSVFRVLK